MSTAVWIVIWIEPAMRAPANGWLSPNSARRAIRPGISSSARRISLRPKSARSMSATLYGTSVTATVRSAFLECGLDLVEGRSGARVDALVQRQVERRQVADEDEVEELGQLAVAPGLDLGDVGDDLVDHPEHEL